MGMGMPETRYARSGDVSIAYQVLGEGPFDVVFAPGCVSHVELHLGGGGLALLCCVVLPSMRGCWFSTSGARACRTGSRVRRRWRSAAMTSGR